jgi:1A family penicillin-binding protein
MAPTTTSAPVPPRSRLFRLLRALFRPARILLGLSLVALAVLAFLGWCLLRIPVGGGMAPEASPASLILESRDGAAFATRGSLHGDPVEPGSIPKPLIDAVVAIEDRRFFDHHGVDLRGIARAGWRNMTGERREGASTITQQLARLLFLSQEQSLIRKTQEAMLALWLETRLSKEEILARYLNAAYFGAGATGVDAAARRYFGKPASAVNLAEAAMLAGLVRAPSALAPTRNLEGARRRADLVLSVIGETGRATPEELAAARAAPPALRTPPEMQPGRGYIADWVEGEARRLVGPIPIDLAVRSTLDPALQDLAEKVVGRSLDREGERQKAGQAALLAISHDGAVLAAVGGRDYATSQFNRITQARRQPGSLFKLFTYAAALEAGMRPDSMVVDRPVQIGNWAPGNSSGSFRGAMTLRQAFSGSVNTVAVQLFQSVGRERVLEMARRMGLRSEMPAVPSIALGSGEATLLEMVTAFASIPGNRTVEPYVVRGVRARDRTLYARPEGPMGGAQVMSPAAQQDMLDLLLAVVRDGTGRAARLDRPVAGKTGTTQDNRDAWFIGMTADVVVGVWVGNDDNSPMQGVSGGGLPARIWHDFVDEADRVKTAEAPLPAEAPATTAEAPRQVAPLRGPARVVDTATLRIGDRAVQLAGVIGQGGEYARDMESFIGGREVTCEPVADGAHRCSVAGRDLAEVVLSNGGGQAAPEASPGLRRREAAARAAGLGIWGRR